MTTNISLRPKPEDEELQVKRRELATLEKNLIERELDLASLRAELTAFEKLYLKVVGVKYAELDEIEAQIAELRSRLEPNNDEAAQQARAARSRAEETRATTELAISNPVLFSPSQSLKSLYRQVAKAIHPDLATDDADRSNRQRLMAEANKAYAEGDETRLRQILEQYESSPDLVVGEGTAAELVRVIRNIAQIKRRLAEIEKEIGKLMESEIANLEARAEEESKQGRDLLSQMAQAVSQRIEKAQSTLTRLSKGQG